MSYEPTLHQNEDSNSMIEYQHALLWADPGTGKTVTAMEALRKHPLKPLEVGLVIIVAPKIALEMWSEELQKHLGLARYQIGILRTGTWPKSTKTKPPLEKRKVLIVTTDLYAKHKQKFQELSRRMNPEAKMLGTKMVRGKEVPIYEERWVYLPTVIVIDESHAFKAAGNKRTTAMHGTATLVKQTYNSMPENLDVWQLTGTPMTCHADDLFMQLAPYRWNILRHHNVETLHKWKEAFCVMRLRSCNGRPQRMVVTGSKNLKRLEQVLKDCGVIRRTLEEVVKGLPPITYRDIHIDAKGVPTVTVNYETVTRELAKPDSAMSKARRLLGVAKAPEVAEYLVSEGRRPTLVGFWHRDVRSELMEQVSQLDGDAKMEFVDGSTPPGKKELIIKQFNAGQIDFLFGQYKAMGVAINLQESCDHVILAEELTSPGDFDQFIARVFRRGQKRHVQVDSMKSRHDLDDALRWLRLGKEKTVDTLGL